MLIQFVRFQNYIHKLAVVFLISAYFSISALGTAATNISLIAFFILWLLCGTYRDYLSVIKQYHFALIAVILFIIFGISLCWTSNIDEGINYWFKYRKYILLPVCIIFMSKHKYNVYGQYALFFSLLITLVISYLVYFSVFTNPPRQHQLENHIFHGITIPFLSNWALDLAFQNKYKFRFFFILIYLACFVEVFVIRDGRTGYILFVSLSLLFIYQAFRCKGLLICFLMVLPAVFYFLLENNIDSFKITNISNMNLDSIAQSDIRLEFYINTVRIIADNWLFGVGIGDFSSNYEKSHLFHYWGLTVNPHNEYLLVTAVSGIFGLIFFVLFLFFLFKQALSLPRERSKMALATVMCITISCLFNSSFLDSNDGNLFVLLIGLFVIGQSSFTTEFRANETEKKSTCQNA